MIEVRGLVKTYRLGGAEVRALDGVTLTIEPGEFVALTGPSGSGKSTLMHVLGMLDAPDAGSYRFMGREVFSLPSDRLAAFRARSVGFVFQQFNLLPRLTALENVSLPLFYSGRTPPVPPAELLKRVGLGDRGHHRPNQLSGGQQQRVAIARALVNAPPVIFADEPTGNLDSSSEKEIMALLTELNAQGVTVILVTHEPEIAAHARRLLRLRDGRVQSDERRGASSVGRLPAAEDGGRSAEKGPKAFLRRWFGHLRMAWSSVMANKARSGLSVLGILIGVGAVITVFALGAGARRSIEERLSSMGTNLLMVRSGSRQVGGVAQEAGAGGRLSLEDAREIAALPGVARTAPSVSGRVQLVAGNRNWNTQVRGVTASYSSMRAAVPVAGRFFTPQEESSRARVVVLGMTPARELFGGRSPVGETVKVNRVSFQVVGVLAEKGASGWQDQDDVILVPVATAMRRLLGKDFVDSIDVEVADPQGMEAVQESLIDGLLRRRRMPLTRREAFEVRNMAELQETLSQTSRTMTLLLSSIAAVSLLVGGIGIMNIMLVSVTERTREIGLRKAVGAEDGDVLSQFLVEAVVVSLAGGVMGILLGAGASAAMAQGAGWAVEVSAGAVSLAFFFSAGVGVAFGLWPARRASRLQPIEALRSE